VRLLVLDFIIRIYHDARSPERQESRKHNAHPLVGKLFNKEVPLSHKI